MKTRFSIWTFVGFSLLAGACSTTSVIPESEMTFHHVMTEDHFEDVIEQFTKTARSYDGLVNNYQFSATLHSTAVIEALTWKKGLDLQWSQNRFVEEKRKLEEQANTRTQVFLSFFTPLPDSDDLNLGKSMWKVYLEVGGARYEGTVEKVNDNLLQLKSLYHHHTRFNTPYLVTFNVPTLSAQQGNAKLTITSAVGSSDLSY